MQGLIKNKNELVLGICCLIAGTLEYISARPAESTLFLRGHEQLQEIFAQLPNLYGSFGSVAPDFFHPLAFALMSMAFVSAKRTKLIICGAWFVIDALAELGQMPGSVSVNAMSASSISNYITESVVSYLRYGTFDIYDLVAISVGCLVAVCIVEMNSRNGGAL